MKKILLVATVTILLATGCRQAKPIINEPNTITSPSLTMAFTSTVPKLSEPLANALTRITKKPFGIHITPATSPITPEKFKGFHTGTDFETLDTEKDIDITVNAVCNGKLLLKKSATGYGGVAVQSCVLDGANITVVYGHLKHASITLNTGDAITAGKQIAILGKGYSGETDEERKHLHLGIHKGTNIVLLGYVQNKTDLSNWLNVGDFLK